MTNVVNWIASLLGVLFAFAFLLFLPFSNKRYPMVNRTIIRFSKCFAIGYITIQSLYDIIHNGNSFLFDLCADLKCCPYLVVFISLLVLPFFATIVIVGTCFVGIDDISENCRKTPEGKTIQQNRNKPKKPAVTIVKQKKKRKRRKRK